jgi:5'-nucleotidase
MNPSGVRSTIVDGEINYADIVAVLPFENTFNVVEINGTAIREVLEFGVSDLENLNVVQVAGIKVVFDLKREPYDRIVNLKVICQECDIPHYGKIDDEKIYKVVMPNHIEEGGNGFTMIPKYVRRSVMGPRDVDALSDYIMRTSPIAVPPLKGRITFQ